MLKYIIKTLFGKKYDMFFRIIFPLGFAIIVLLALLGLLNNDKPYEAEAVALTLRLEDQKEKDSVLDALSNLGSEAEVSDKKIKRINKINADVKTDFINYILVKDLDEAKTLMDDGLVRNYIEINKTDERLKVKMNINSLAASDSQNSIVYNVFNSFTQIYNAYAEGTKEYVESAMRDGKTLNEALEEYRVNIIAKTNSNLSFVKNIDNGKSTNTMSGFFHAILAYVCIYFMSSGYSVVQLSEANKSLPARVEAVSPTSKTKMILMRFIVISILSVITACIAVTIYYFAGVPLGNHYLATFALVILGVIVGLLLGMLVAAIEPASSSREGIFSNIALIGFPLVCAFLSGMIGTGPGNFRNKLPILAKYNPVGLISTAFYYLNEYPTLEQYWKIMLVLSIYAIISLLLVMFFTKRSNYEYL